MKGKNEKKKMENKTPEKILFDQIELAKAEYPDENWMSSEQILAAPEFSFVINAINEYGKQQYNQAIKDAAKLATARVEYDDFDGTYDAFVNKQSILKLLK